MTTRVSVLGVLALCWRVSLNPTQLQPAPLLGFCASVLGVLGLSRARVCAYVFFIHLLRCVPVDVVFSSCARELNTPNTPNTLLLIH